MTNGTILIDALGLRCPMPVQKLRSVIKKTEHWNLIRMVVDDPEALHDIPALLDRMSIIKPVINKQDIGWLLIITNIIK